MNIYAFIENLNVQKSIEWKEKYMIFKKWNESLFQFHWNCCFVEFIVIKYLNLYKHLLYKQSNNKVIKIRLEEHEH